MSKLSIFSGKYIQMFRSHTNELCHFILHHKLETFIFIFCQQCFIKTSIKMMKNMIHIENYPLTFPYLKENNDGINYLT